MRSYFPLLLMLLTVSLFGQHPFSRLSGQFPGSAMPVSDRNGPPVCQPDSLVQYSFTSPTDSVFGDKFVWQYSGNDKPTYYYVNNGSPLLVAIDSIVYDDLDRLAVQEIKQRSFQTNELELQHRSIYVWHGNTPYYDSTITYNLDFFNHTEKPAQKTVQIFDANNLVVRDTAYSWDNIDKFWSYDYHTVYTNLPNGQVSQWERETWLGIKVRYLFTYSPTGKSASYEYQKLDGQTWVPQMRGESSYDANDSLSLFLQTNLLTNAVNFKRIYHYDPVAHRTEEEYFAYDDNTQALTDSGTAVHDWDDQGRLERTENTDTYVGNGTTGGRKDFFYIGNDPCPRLHNAYSLVNGNWEFRTRGYYFPYTTVPTQEPAGATAWSAYPNPAQNWLWLDAPAGSPFRMYDLQGRLLYSGEAKGGERLSLTGLRGAVLLVVGEGKTATSRWIQVGQ